MADDEWYRSAAWAPDDQAEFERRLRRARPANRGQYLRLKGLALRAAGELTGARELWERALEDPGDVLERWMTLEHLADLDADCDPQRAKTLYRQLLEENPSLNATSRMAEVRLAELLIREGTPESLAEARELLDAWATTRRSPFPVHHYQHQLALVRWGLAVGDHEVTREAARGALIHADGGSPFPRHPDAGVVPDKDVPKAWLNSLIDGPRT